MRVTINPREELLLVLSALDDACTSPETLRRKRKHAPRKALVKELRESLPYPEPDRNVVELSFSD
jgi:hypothetical protein